MNISLQQINTLLAQEDIEGLIEAGAPSNEYTTESQVIFMSLKELKNEEVNEENISFIITSVWEQSFNLDAPEISQRQKAINIVAQNIVQAASKSQV